MNHPMHQLRACPKINGTSCCATACSGIRKRRKVPVIQLGSPDPIDSRAGFEEFQGRGQPVVSVITKKKKLVGGFQERGGGIATTFGEIILCSFSGIWSDFWGQLYFPLFLYSCCELSDFIFTNTTLFCFTRSAFSVFSLSLRKQRAS